MPFLRAVCSFCLLAFSFLSGFSAFAADYRVSYAIDAGDVNDAGTVRCDDASDCRIELKKQDFTITLRLVDHSYRAVTIGISGGSNRWGGCYFADGMDEVVRDVTAASPIRLGIYIGRRQSHPRRSSEYLINEPLGILYLQFPDVS
jgi:hypothetical protein